MDVSLEAIGRAIEGEVDLSDIAGRAGVPQWFTLWPGEHYVMLGAMMLTLRPRVVVEIGTDAGLSALAMKKYLPGEGRIVTFDIRGWKTIDYTVLNEGDFADGRLEQRLEDLSDWAAIEKNRELLEAAEFLFIDAPKDGVFEYRLMEHFGRLSFARRPIVWFDDTKLWSMLRFWRELAYPKLDLTSFGSWSGSGVVEMVKG
jgi:hypothetical protein